MTVTAIDFKQRFPEFSDMPDPAVEFNLEEAGLFAGTWSGPGRDLAVMYLAAHFTAISRVSADTDGRDIVSETIGRLSTTYRSPQAGSAVIMDFGTTSYGKRYQQLLSLGQKKFESVSSDQERAGVWGLNLMDPGRVS
jgi:Protein of unknown function (DUF4054)